MSTRPVPVPDTCTASYALMTPSPLEHEDHLPMPNDSLLRRYGTSDAALSRLQECPHQLVVQCQAPVERMADAVRDARVDLLDRAARLEGVVLELLPPRVLELRPEQVSLAHAAQWYVLDYDDLADGVLRTDGLAQFGLPEVVVSGIDVERHAMTDAVVAGLAHRLIAEWPEHDPVGPATVTLRDIAYGLGDADAAHTPADRTIDMLIDYEPVAHHLLVELMADPAEVLFN
jgi:hypothetical protein